MAEKQAHLNGAYYGPSVPPTTNYHRPGRGSGCGCGCCLLKCLLQIIVTIVVVVGLAVLIVWLIFRPINPIKFHATNVSLTEFNLTNNTLHYNLALNITVRNPNKKIGIYYDRIEARAYYEDQRFHTQTLTPFYQGHKNTSHINPVFQGQHIVMLGADEIAEFNQEKTSGVFSIDVKLYFRIRFRFGKVKVGKFKPKVSCDLKVPLSSVNGSVARGAPETTKCDWDF